MQSRFENMPCWILYGALCVSLLTCQDVLSKTAAGGYQGLEYFGSSQMTRLELEKCLALHQGATYQQGLKAAARLQEKLAARKIKASINIAAAKSTQSEGAYWITVDILETGLPSVPVRNLKFPHHVDVDSTIPFALLNDILSRRQLLAAQGKAVSESYDDGSKHFSDEPCEQYAAKLLRQVPPLQNQLLSVVASDPDPDRRSKAIEVLNWDGSPYRTSIALIPAIDDASEQVRVSAARYLQPRIKLLPDNFPWAELVEVFSHQLARPGHVDRLLALTSLSSIAQSNPAALHTIKIFGQEKLKDIVETSKIPEIKLQAQKLLDQCASVSTPDTGMSENSPANKAAEPLTEF